MEWDIASMSNEIDVTIFVRNPLLGPSPTRTLRNGTAARTSGLFLSVDTISSFPDGER